MRILYAAVPIVAGAAGLAEIFGKALDLGSSLPIADAAVPDGPHRFVLLVRLLLYRAVEELLDDALTAITRLLGWRRHLGPDPRIRVSVNLPQRSRSRIHATVNHASAAHASLRRG
jgi:hypothetical protein